MTDLIDADRSRVDEGPEKNLALGLMGRALLILVLFNRAAYADLLSFENPGTSIVATLYVGALLVMAGSLVLFWRNFTNEPAPTRADPNAVAARRVYGLFTEPWYEVPAVSCMLLAGMGFVSNLVAEPPESTRARWFLASLVLVALAGAIRWLGNRARRDGSARLGAPGRPGAEWPRTGPLSDRGFRVPLFAFLLLSGAHAGVVRIDAEPSSIVAWIFYVMGAALVIIAIVSLIQSSRRKSESTS